MLSDFKDKSQYYFPNLDVSSKTGSESNFFDLHTAKKLQLIDSAACRLRFKLAEMKLTETHFYTQNSLDIIIVR